MEKLRAHVRGETEEEEKRKRTEWEEKGEGKRTAEKKAPETFSAEKRCAPLTCRSTSEGRERLDGTAPPTLHCLSCQGVRRAAGCS